MVNDIREILDGGRVPSPFLSRAWIAVRVDWWSDFGRAANALTVGC